MTDEEIMKAMTNSMRLLNTTRTRIETIYESINPACPVCALARQITLSDLESIEAARVALAQASRNDRDNRIVAATSATCLAALVADKSQVLYQMAEAAHQAMHELSEGRFEDVFIGNPNDDVKQQFEERLIKAGFTKVVPDPSKLN